jgi:phospholipase/lecithinase/hemolysin
MKQHYRFTIVLMLWGLGFLPAFGAFTSFHVFGDGLSCTTTNAEAGTNYFGKRYTNGRVWVEVLAQMQGLTFNPSNNPHAYFGNTSSNLLAQTTAYAPPSDASNALVIIWVNNADLYFPALDSTPTLAKFTNAVNLALTNQFRAITNLYAKGIRILVMPNVVDISSIPEFNIYASQTNLFHQASTNYNALFYPMLGKASEGRADLKIIVPDFFGLLTNMIASSASYGLTNALGNGLSIAARDARNFGLPVANTNGYGTNYIFWDSTDPTAKVHFTMAGIANAMLSPPVITSVTAINGSNRLDLASLPGATVGATNCFVLFATNLNQNVWQTNFPAFTSLTATQSVFVPAVGPQRFYRLKSNLAFPWPWVWP